MKAFVIGDIHGCLSELKELIKDIDRSTTRIICVGDLIDRGKDSEGVVDFMRSNNIECVKGNHELMAEECLEDLYIYRDYPDKSIKDILNESDWFYNGGNDVFNQYSSIDNLITDIEWLAKLPLYIETGIKDSDNLELLVSHTWCSYKDLSSAKRRVFDFLWDRDQPTRIKNRSPYYNIYGHTPVNNVSPKKYARMQGPDIVPEPHYSDGCVNIDTGCCYNLRGRGYLTGIYFPSLEERQVKLKD